MPDPLTDYDRKKAKRVMRMHNFKHDRLTGQIETLRSTNRHPNIAQVGLYLFLYEQVKMVNHFTHANI